MGTAMTRCVLTKSEVARRLGRSRQFIDLEIARGRLRAQELAPRLWVVSPADLARYQASVAEERLEPTEAMA
jgi:IS30 family transposase